MKRFKKLIDSIEVKEKPLVEKKEEQTEAKDSKKEGSKVTAYIYYNMEPFCNDM